MDRRIGLIEFAWRSRTEDVGEDASEKPHQRRDWEAMRLVPATGVEIQRPVVAHRPPVRLPQFSGTRTARTWNRSRRTSASTT
jgi:hypothetical protein